jgi:hypothetical protein
VAGVQIHMNKKLRDLLSGALVAQFSSHARASLDEAATRATATSREVFDHELKRRESAAPRVGRPTTGGAFSGYLQWAPRTTSKGSVVSFDYERIDSKAPYWIIQEVGTGRSFKVLGTTTNGFAGNIRTQRGRGLPFGLQWGVGGAYVSPGSFDGAQLQPVSTLRVPAHTPLKRMRIRQEIEGKHFVRLGGQEGFRFYEASLRSEFRRIFQ